MVTVGAAVYWLPTVARSMLTTFPKVGLPTVVSIFATAVAPLPVVSPPAFVMVTRGGVV